MYTCWRDWSDIIVTAHGTMLPPSWPAWTAASPDAVRHGHALARARCISKEERFFLDLLTQTETHSQAKPPKRGLHLYHAFSQPMLQCRNL